MDTLVELLQAKHGSYTTLELAKGFISGLVHPVCKSVFVCTYAYVYKPGTSPEGSVGAPHPHQTHSPYCLKTLVWQPHLTTLLAV